MVSLPLVWLRPTVARKQKYHHIRRRKVLRPFYYSFFGTLQSSANVAELKTFIQASLRGCNGKLKEIHLTLELPVQAFPLNQSRPFQELGEIVRQQNAMLVRRVIKLGFFGMRLRCHQEKLTCWCRDRKAKEQTAYVEGPSVQARRTMIWIT